MINHDCPAEIEQIETLLRRARISHVAFCRMAGVGTTTWGIIRRDRRIGNVQTLQKIESARRRVQALLQEPAPFLPSGDAEDSAA